MWDPICADPTSRRCSIAQVVAALGDHAAEPILSRFSRDLPNVTFPEFLRYLAWFGFSDTVFPFLAKVCSDPTAQVKALVWPGSDKVFAQMRHVLNPGWVVCLTEVPGEFAICGRSNIPVRFDALSDRLSVGSQDFASWDELLGHCGVLEPSSIGPTESAREITAGIDGTGTSEKQ
jgi:hypothetical protein